MLEIAMFQPDIAANAGTIARLCACTGMKLVIIEPAGFAWDDAKLRRAGMDYLDLASIRRSASWAQFQEESKHRRLLLLTTKSATAYTDHHFQPDDVLLLGRESAGVPDNVHEAVAARLTIPMQQGARSLTLACAMVTGEAVRQLKLIC